MGNFVHDQFMINICFLSRLGRKLFIPALLANDKTDLSLLVIFIYRLNLKPLNVSLNSKGLERTKNTGLASHHQSGAQKRWQGAKCERSLAEDMFLFIVYVFAVGRPKPALGHHI